MEELNEIFQAVVERKLQELKDLLCQHPVLINAQKAIDIGGGRERLVTPLLEACFKGNDKAVSALIEHGADVNAIGRMRRLYEPGNRGKRTYGEWNDIFPLYVAIVGSSSVWCKLIGSGTNVNQSTSTGHTALHAICMKKEDICDAFAIDRVKRLIYEKANVNAIDITGKTPLHHAAQQGKTSFVEVLLENGADSNIRDNNNYSVLEIAANEGHLEIVEQLLLLRSSSWDGLDQIHAYEIVGFFSFENIYNTMKRALDLREKHNIPKRLVDTPFCGGITEWQTEDELEANRENFLLLQIQCQIARERIFSGRYIDPRPLNVIATTMILNEDSLLSDLISHFIEVFQQNEDYLYFAEYFIEANCVPDYLKKNSVVDMYYSAQNSSNATVLHILFNASQSNLVVDANVIKTIIKVGIKSAIKIKEALKTGANIAALQELVMALEQTLFGLAVLALRLTHQTEEEDGTFESILKQMCVSFNHIEAKTISYRTSLMHVLMDKICKQCKIPPNHPNYEFVNLLVKAGADVNYLDSEGNTLLHLAFGANYNPLFYIATFIEDDTQCDNFDVDLIEMLVDLDVHLDARNKAGKTAKDLLMEMSTIDEDDKE